MDTYLIASCGINCAVCRYHMRAKKPCPGCRAENINKSASCVTCLMKNCAELKQAGRYDCADCPQFPCDLVSHLDKRYRTKWGASPVRNLREIHGTGMAEFLRVEDERWTCPHCGNLLSMHFWNCPSCGEPRVPTTQ
jgi:hypothetical protein